MRLLAMQLYFLNNTAHIGDRSIHLMCSTTGHYSLPLTKWDLEVENTRIVF